MKRNKHKSMHFQIYRLLMVSALMLMFAVNAYSYKHAELSDPTDITAGGAKFTSSLPEGAINPRLQLALGKHAIISQVISPYSGAGFEIEETAWVECTDLEGGGIKTDTSGADLKIKFKAGTLEDDTEFNFEWATDTDESSDSFKLVYYVVENGSNIKKTAAEIAGYHKWTTESVVLPKGAFKIEFKNTRTGNVVGSGIVKIRNLEIHTDDVNTETKWIDYPAKWSESMSLRNLPPDRNITARVVADMPDGEKVYSQMQNFRTLYLECLRPSDSSPYSLDFSPRQTSADVAGNFIFDDIDCKYGFKIFTPGFVYNPGDVSNVKLEGWDCTNNKDGKPVTISFDCDSPVTVNLYIKLNGYRTETDWWSGTHREIPSTARISAPYDVNIKRGTHDLNAEFPAGHNSFTITPSPENNYSMSISLNFSKIGITKKIIKAHNEIIYGDTKESRVTFSKLTPDTEYEVIPFVETNGDVFDPTPQFFNLQKLKNSGLISSGSSLGNSGSNSDKKEDEHLPYTYKFRTLNGIPGPVTAETSQTSLSLSATVDAGDGRITEAGFRYALKGTTNYAEKIVEPDESGNIRCELERLRPDTQYSVESFVMLENCNTKAYSEPLEISTKPIELNLAISKLTQSTISYNMTIEYGDTELIECGLEDGDGKKYPYDGEIAEGKWHQTVTGLSADSPYTFKAYAVCISDPDRTFYSPSRNDNTKNVYIGTTKIVRIDKDFNLVIEAEADLGDAIYESLKCYDDKLYSSGDEYVYGRSTKEYEIEVKDGKIITHIPGTGVDKDKIYYRIKYAGKNPVKTGLETYLSTFNIKNTIQATSADFIFTPSVTPDSPETLSFAMTDDLHKNAVVSSDFTGSEYKVHVSGLNPGRKFGLKAICGRQEAVYQTRFREEFKTLVPEFKFNIKTTQTTATFTKEDVNLNGVTGGYFKIVLKFPGMKNTYKSADMKWDEPCVINGLSPNQRLKYFIYYYSAEGDPGICIIDDETLRTSPIYYPAIKAVPYQTAIVVDYDDTSFVSGDIDAAEWGYQIGNYRIAVETGGGTIIFKNLYPDREYDIYPYIKDAENNIHSGNSSSSCEAHVKTKPIVVRTGEVTHISNNSAWLHGHVECDRYSDAKIGFEYKGSGDTWERHVFIPATVDEDFNAITAFKPGFLDPEMGYYYRCVVEYPEGNIISDIAYNNNTSYEKRWKWFRTEKEFVFFEPGVYAAFRTDHTTNSIVLQGYIHYGSEDILSCGYYYWRIDGNEKVRKVPAGATKIKTDEDMIFNISEAGLADGDYRIVPYVETASGEVIGDELSFVIGSSGLEDSGIVAKPVNVVGIEHGVRIDNADGQRAMIYNLSGNLIKIADVYGNSFRVDNLPSRSLIMVRLSSGSTFKIMTK